VKDEDQERERRGRAADEGRQALLAMVRGFREVSAVCAGLTHEVKTLGSQVALLCETNADLARQNAELAQMIRSGCEHSAALQAQVGALVHAVSRSQGQPVGVFPPQGLPMQDPFGRFGAAVVNGAIDHLRGGRGGPRPY
jgi:hypothetical protein